MYQVYGRKRHYEMPFTAYETRNKQSALNELNEHTDKQYTLSDMPKKNEEKRFRSKYPDCLWIYVSNFKKEY